MCPPDCSLHDLTIPSGPYGPGSPSPHRPAVVSARTSGGAALDVGPAMKICGPAVLRPPIGADADAPLAGGLGCPSTRALHTATRIGEASPGEHLDLLEQG
eukprot:CAMPEP_0171185064 /NCGR_PEP_ID=MMETSP0790-20130122/16105_1 /TAXON_ID=2925 /ORGANISM="Alexandrium catenella, Strain OF101" /LENGTH=100 /DNA_ID=CAMNT_0011650067 /DNA_START=168 /DNA_END=470 /DNA_ORIENTATION=+